MEFEQTLEGVQRWEVYFKTGKEALEDNDYNVAQNHLEKALQEVRKYGDSDPRLANVYYALGDLYSKKEDFEKAANNYYKVIDIWERSLGKNYSGLAKILERYGYTLRLLGNTKEADIITERMKEIQKNQF